MRIISGCSSGSANASRSLAKEEIAAIQTAVGEAQPIVDYMKKYIDWQVTTTEASMKEEHEALDAGKAYVPSVDPQTEYDQVKSIADELKTYGEEMKKSLSDIKTYEDTGIEQVEATRKAAIEFFDRLSSSIDDLLSVSDFYMAEYDALEPTRSIDGSQYTDKSRLAKDMTDALGQVYDNFKKIDCPDYMSQTWQQYMKQIYNYQILYRSMYIGLVLEDPLRQTADVYMSKRVDTLLVKYGDRLTTDFNLQFTQVGSRLDTEMIPMKSEIDDACTKLKASL